MKISSTHSGARVGHPAEIQDAMEIVKLMGDMKFIVGNPRKSNPRLVRHRGRGTNPRNHRKTIGHNRHNTPPQGPGHHPGKCRNVVWSLGLRSSKTEGKRVTA